MWSCENSFPQYPCIPMADSRDNRGPHDPIIRQSGGELLISIVAVEPSEKIYALAAHFGQAAVYLVTPAGRETVQISPVPMGSEDDGQVL